MSVIDKDELTERELAVLQYLADGLKEKEIVEKLNVSLFTVKHIKRTFVDKLMVSNAMSAVATAIRRGLID